MTRSILVINAGSSSLKFQIFAIEGDGLDRRVRGQLDGIGVRPRLVASGADGTEREEGMRRERGPSYAL